MRIEPSAAKETIVESQIDTLNKNELEYYEKIAEFQKKQLELELKEQKVENGEVYF